MIQRSTDSMAHSTTPRSTPTRLRREESSHKAIREIRRHGLPESKLPDRFWVDMEAAAVRAYGPDTGKDVFRALRIGEFDFDFASEVLLGVDPLAWQADVWARLQEKSYGTVAASNAGGKTTSFCLYYFIAGTYRQWAPEWWDVYEMLHHGPLEVHALQVRLKMQQILEGHAREQAKKIKGGYTYRPCLLEPFVHAMRADEGKHEAYSWFEGWSTLIFRSTAFKAKGSDGSAPHFIGEDELRYELNLTHVVEFVYLPRFIRAPGGRLYLPITFLEASVEAVTLHERGKQGEKDWFAVDIDISANNKIGAAEKEKANRNLGKRARAQVLGGRPIQPMGAKFSHESVSKAFYGGKEPDWLDNLDRARERAETRCKLCQERRRKKADDWSPRERDHDRHMIIGAVDPASSAAYDAIPATAWDLEPFGDPGIDVLYIEELEPGTPIQRVAAHLVRMSRTLRGEVGYDRKSALGHAIKDLLVELDPDGEYVEISFDSSEEKDQGLDYFGGLMDGGVWRCPQHAITRSQITNYVRRDAKIPTDFLMVQVVAAQVAKPYLPDLSAPTGRPEGGDFDDTDAAYNGITGDDLFSDPYAGIETMAPVGDEEEAVR